MTAEYKETKFVGKAGSTSLVYLPKRWGFEGGDIVTLKVKRFNTDDEFCVRTGPVCKYGTGVAVFLDKAWGFKPKDMVEISVSRRESCDSS